MNWYTNKAWMFLNKKLNYRLIHKRQNPRVCKKLPTLDLPQKHINVSHYFISYWVVYKFQANPRRFGLPFWDFFLGPAFKTWNKDAPTRTNWGTISFLLGEWAFVSRPLSEDILWSNNWELYLWGRIYKALKVLFQIFKIE